MWPAHWSLQKIQKTISEAWINAGRPGGPGPRWSGLSNDGFGVTGFPKLGSSPYDVQSAWPNPDVPPVQGN